MRNTSKLTRIYFCSAIALASTLGAPSLSLSAESDVPQQKDCESKPWLCKPEREMTADEFRKTVASWTSKQLREEHERRPTKDPCLATYFDKKSDLAFTQIFAASIFRDCSPSKTRFEIIRERWNQVNGLQDAPAVGQLQGAKPAAVIQGGRGGEFGGEGPTPTREKNSSGTAD